MEIWYANLPLKKGSSVQGGTRPVVIISNDVCNEVNSVITVAPMTRQMKKLSQPTHAIIDTPDGGQSVVLGEQIMAIDKNLLDNRMGRIRDEDVERIENAIKEQLGMSGKERI